MAFYAAGPDVEFFPTPDAVPAELQDGSADDSAAATQDTQDPTATADTQAPNNPSDNPAPNAASDNQANTPEMAVQAALAERRYYKGPVDGRIGVTSTQAIARFQAENRLPVTGTITPELMQALGIN
jgi:peptidoglycan hydrolase-like protein with peptidoglycan-binding domain